MNINPNIPSLDRKNSPKFKAIPLARYQTAKDSYIKIYQLEKKDLPFVSKFLKGIKQYFADKNINDFSRQQVMEESFGAAEKILSSPWEKKARIFLAVTESNPCGILIGNVLKCSKNHKLTYSSRKNHAKNETELDWIATWNPFTDKNPKNAGKVITAEYFETLKKDKFRDVYVRSELPELSYAAEFYNKMGFEELPNKRESIIKPSTNRYLIGDFDASDDEIVPMVATRSNIRKIKREISDNFHRMKLASSSIDINSVIK